MTSRRRGLARVFARLAVIAIAALAVFFVQAPGASADDECSIEQWRTDWTTCVDALPDDAPTMCKKPPVAWAPDSGMAGWFSSEPEWLSDKDYQDVVYTVPAGRYTSYGYAGYELPTYDLGCVGSAVPDGDSAGNSLANLEFTLATGIIGASNGLRQAAWEPAGLWGWADEFVSTASEAIFRQVFSVFGGITLGLVGLYLIWRSRQADMSMAVTTAGWAVLVLVVVTAVAQYPVQAANLADKGLTSSLGVVQSALGPAEAENCEGKCEDVRSPAQRASDMATEEVLYANWVRSVLGQSAEATYQLDEDGEQVIGPDGEPVAETANTAYKYGPALYDSVAFTWEEITAARADPGQRQQIVAEKETQWRKIAAAIAKEDPEAYQHLTGANGWDRVGTGFLAVLAALFFALFDITASILIILGFLLIRWAVVALPLIGTVAILRPASGGFKRLVSAVLAAIINVVVFGVAAAVYLFAVSRILAASMPGWLQVLLIALTGAVAWMLLRPYRRIGSLRGGSSISDAAFGRKKHVETDKRVTVKDGKYRTETVGDDAGEARTASTKDPIMASPRERAAGGGGGGALPPRPVPGQAAPESRAGRSKPGYSVYRPSGAGSGARSGDRPLIAVRPD
ncbi:MFS transporter [Stackebrandtia soli]|uniref:MFS transporter n=1 Tax=Stackebrandtia soli TaxID=1892856 RepID=UPI0039E87926